MEQITSFSAADSRQGLLNSPVTQAQNKPEDFSPQEQDDDQSEQKNVGNLRQAASPVG